MYHLPDKTKNKNNQQGFTLVEVLVSLALFTLVTTMSVGTLLVLIDANSKQQNMQSVMTNISFALDSMTREIRTGYYYECRTSSGSLTKDNSYNGDGSNCGLNGTSNFAFIESGGSLTEGMTSNRIAYKLNNGSIERRLGNPDQIGTYVDWTPITAPEVFIDTLEFILTGACSLSDTGSCGGDLLSPTVTIFISGTAGDIDGLDTSFNLQTTVTQQILDI